MSKRKAKSVEKVVVETKDGILCFSTITVPEWSPPHTFHNPKTFMDYLHGDVAAEEAWLACHYEYARESPSFWTAAAKRDEEMKNGLGVEKAAISALEQMPYESATSLPSYATDFLCCAGFPKKDWQQLSKKERKEIIRYSPGGGIRPLHNPDVWSLKSRGVLDKFKKMGEDARPVVQNVPVGQAPKPMILVPAILQQHESLFHAIFTLDFSKSVTQLGNEFKEWLQLPENKARLKRFKKVKIGATGKPLDRLKDLAAWRLFRELENDWNAANDFANTHRKKSKPFHSARRQDGVPANEADLFGENSDARKAKKSASDYLKEVMPLDFSPPPKPLMDSVLRKIDRLAS